MSPSLSMIGPASAAMATTMRTLSMEASAMMPEPLQDATTRVYVEDAVRVRKIAGGNLELLKSGKSVWQKPRAAEVYKAPAFIGRSRVKYVRVRWYHGTARHLVCSVDTFHPPPL